MTAIPQTIQPATRIGAAFWLQWVLANAAALAISAVLTLAQLPIAEVMSSPTSQGMVEAVIRALVPWLGILNAALIGMLYWLVLRRQVRWAGQWWFATSLGWIAGGFLAPYAAFVVLGARPPTLSFNAVTATVGAAVVGIVQWFVLRRWVRRAGWWVLASIAGWAIGRTSGSYAGFYVALYAGGAVSSWGQDLSSIVVPVSFEAAIGAIAGSITGIALVWLLRHPYPETLRSR